MQLMQQGNYELVVRAVKQVKGSDKFEDIQVYVDDPAKFYRDVKDTVEAQKLDVNKYVESYKQYLKSFLTHFRSSMQEWEQWQVDIFMFEIEIISVFLAYKTTEGTIKEDDVINDLILNLDPYEPDISKSSVFLKGQFIKDIATISLIGMLAVIGISLMTGKKR